MSKKKILYIIHSLDVGGAERVVTSLSNHLVDSFEIYIITILTNNSDINISILDKRIHLFELNYDSFKNPKIAYSISSLLRKINPDVIHTHLIYSLLYTCLAQIFFLKRIKMFHTVHGIASVEAPSKTRYLVYFLVLMVFKVRLISISKAVQRSVQKDYGAESILIYNGISSAIDIRIDKNIELILKNIKNRFKIIYVTVGRAHKIKNHLELFKAFTDLQKERKDIALIHVGRIEDNEYGQELKKYLHTNIFSLGEQGNIDGILQMTDRFIIVSLSEGLGLVAIEACKNALPIISTRQDGLLEIIKDGYNGFFTENETSNSIKRAILKIENKSSAEIDEMKKAAKECFNKKFTIEECAAKHIALY